MKHLFIVNPKAGKGKAGQVVEMIHEIFSLLDEEYIIEYTKGIGHATELAKEYSKKGIYRVYSVGGDGTLNEVLNGIVKSQCSLAVIPSGTGNDFIKSFCHIKNLKDIITATVHGEERYIDLVKANDRYFLNIASLGIDADVAYNATRYKKLPLISGITAYLLGLINTLISFKSKEIEVIIDDISFKEKTILLAVANGRYYGGGMLPAPEAKIDDGILDICLVRHLSKFKILRVFPKLIKGTHGDIAEVSFHKGSNIHIISKKDFRFNIDGEILTVNQVLFKLIPRGIRIVVPK